MYTEQDNPQHHEHERERQDLPPVEKNFNDDGHGREEDDTSAEPTVNKKRNSGRTGATSPAGLARSALNSLKHGGCSRTLIIEGESEDAWLLLHDRWCAAYQTSEDSNSLLYDFVRKTAQAEWFRIRCQHHYDLYVLSLSALSPINWTADEIKKHDLLFRYKGAAERAFHRENRALEQHYKLHRPPENKASQPESAPALPQQPEKIDYGPGLTIVAADPDSPTGYVMVCEMKDGRENRDNKGQPFTPPDPLPPDWPKFHFHNAKDTNKVEKKVD